VDGSSLNFPKNSQSDLYFPKTRIIDTSYYDDLLICTTMYVFRSVKKKQQIK